MEGGVFAVETFFPMSLILGQQTIVALLSLMRLEDHVYARGEMNFPWVGGQAWEKSEPIVKCAALS